MTVADITSALLGKRSYKNPYPKAEIIKILNHMVVNGDISGEVVSVLLANYSEICERVYKNAQELTNRYGNMKVEFTELHQWYDSLS